MLTSNLKTHIAGINWEKVKPDLFQGRIYYGGNNFFIVIYKGISGKYGYGVCQTKQNGNEYVPDIRVKFDKFEQVLKDIPSQIDKLI